MGKHPGKSGMWVWVLTLQLIYGVTGTRCLSFLAYNILFCKISTIDCSFPTKYLSHWEHRNVFLWDYPVSHGLEWDGGSPPHCSRVATGPWLVKWHLWAKWAAALGSGAGTRHPPAMCKLLNDSPPGKGADEEWEQNPPKTMKTSRG